MRARNTVSNFLSKFEVDEDTDCWNWTDCKDRSGYGHVTWQREHWYAHRLSFHLAGFEIPKGMCVLHKCDNPSCINPEHLFLGTHADNMQDRTEKGRYAVGDKHSGAKLTTDQVLEIRHRYKTENVSQRELGEEYGVCQVQISSICSGKQWRNVDG